MRHNSDKALAREMLVAVRARLELVAGDDPAEMTSPTTIRESLAFARLLYRQAKVQIGRAREQS